MQTISTMTIAALAAFVGLTNTSCSKTSCGEGTELSGDTCVSALATSCGEGTSLRQGFCVPTSGNFVSCGQGTIQEDDTCAGLVLRRLGNARRATGMGIVTPPAFGGVASGILSDSYRDGVSLMGARLIKGQNGDRLVLDGIATSVIDQSYESVPTALADFAIIGPDEAVEGTFKTDKQTLKLAALGQGFIDVIETELTQVRIEEIDGQRAVTGFHFKGIMTKAAGDAVTLDIIGSSISTFICGQDPDNPTMPFLYPTCPGGEAPDVDLDGDEVNDAWTLEGDAELTETIWIN